LFAEYRVDKVQ